MTIDELRVSKYPKSTLCKAGGMRLLPLCVDLWAFVIMPEHVHENPPPRGLVECPWTGPSTALRTGRGRVTDLWAANQSHRRWIFRRPDEHDLVPSMPAGQAWHPQIADKQKAPER